MGMRRSIQQAVIVFVLVAMAGILPGTAVAQGNAEAGKQLYQTYCSMCHGPDGKADTPIAKSLTPKPRDHTDGAYMNSLSNEHLFKVIKQGGPAVGKAPIMPGQPDLKDAQIQDIITFVRSLAVPPYEAK
jgi:high-affinity iron transporter